MRRLDSFRFVQVLLLVSMCIMVITGLNEVVTLLVKMKSVSKSKPSHANNSLTFVHFDELVEDRILNEYVFPGMVQVSRKSASFSPCLNIRQVYLGGWQTVLLMRCDQNP